LSVEKGVGVVEQSQPSLSSGSSGNRRQVPSVKLLWDIAELVVISVKRAESAQPGPSRTKSLGGVAAETTTVTANHTNTIDGAETEHLANGLDVLVPITDIVAQPQTRGRAREGASRNGEWLLIGSAFEQRVSSSNGVSTSVQVVLVVRSRSVGLDNVRPG
jgi:hypothetical protein